jgi:hypothetical protein
MFRATHQIHHIFAGDLFMSSSVSATLGFQSCCATICAPSSLIILSSSLIISHAQRLATRRRISQVGAIEAYRLAKSKNIYPPKDPWSNFVQRNYDIELFDLQDYGLEPLAPSKYRAKVAR